MRMNDNAGRATRWRIANRERAREISRKSYAKRKSEGKSSAAVAARRKQRLEHPEAAILRSARHRAAKLGIPFNLDLQDISIPSHCPITGLEIILDSLRRPQGPSLDKINPNKGYVKGNVSVISNSGNSIKSNKDIYFFQRLLEYMSRVEWD